MRFLQVMLFLAFVVVANGGKVNWNSSGKPQIDITKDSDKGCRKVSLNSLLSDRNISSSCSK